MYVFSVINTKLGDSFDITNNKYISVHADRYVPDGAGDSKTETDTNTILTKCTLD
jgi:hypothetical protein